MNRELIERCGVALYGPRWQSELARALGVNDRTMRRWIASGNIPIGVSSDLLQLVLERGEQLKELIEPLSRARKSD